VAFCTSDDAIVGHGNRAILADGDASVGAIDALCVEEPRVLALRRRDVADVAGTTLHTARAGLLMSHGRRLTIPDPTELLRIAEEATESLRP